MSPLERHLRRASDLSDLSDPDRFTAKVDMSPAKLEARLREASELLELCRRVAEAFRTEER